ncbi:MAG TPA: SPOR domain-containing protein [Methylobacter sp.]|jgi:DedD protein
MNEQEIQFKKRARRRLVGAIALVLLMVTVLPMVLDDRAAKNPQQEISISIPSQDGTEFTSKIVPVTPDNKPTETPPADVVKPEQQPEPKAENSKSTELPAAPVADASAPAPKPVEKALTPAESSSSEPVQNEAVHKPVLEKKVTEPNTAKGNGLAVQIGVFSDVANVKQLQQKLETQGYKSYTEKLSTAKGEKIRLRAGPFDTRADAESALAKIKESGLSGMIVTNK